MRFPIVLTLTAIAWAQAQDARGQAGVPDGDVKLTGSLRSRRRAG